MFGNLFAPMAMKVAGGIGIALALALAVTMFQLSSARSTIKDRDKSLALKTAQLTISNQSVATLETALAGFVGAGKASRAAQLAAIEAQAKKSASLRSYAAQIRAELATMKPGDPCDCSTPDFVMEGR